MFFVLLLWLWTSTTVMTRTTTMAKMTMTTTKTMTTTMTTTSSPFASTKLLALREIAPKPLSMKFKAFSWLQNLSLSRLVICISLTIGTLLLLLPLLPLLTKSKLLSCFYSAVQDFRNLVIILQLKFFGQNKKLIIQNFWIEHNVILPKPWPSEYFWGCLTSEHNIRRSHFTK